MGFYQSYYLNSHLVSYYPPPKYCNAYNYITDDVFKTKMTPLLTALPQNSRLFSSLPCSNPSSSFSNSKFNNYFRKISKENGDY